MQSEERRQVTARWGQEMYNTLRAILPTVSNEAGFRQHVDPLLNEFCAEIGLNYLAHAEYTLATGRADAVFNRFVIEYERPGTLKNPPNKATLHAIQQVKDYIEALAKKERHAVERLAGVAFDGHYLIFVRRTGDHWTTEGPFPVNTDSLERFLTWLAGLASGIALTSENLSRDFSLEQLRTQNILRGLYQALNAALAGQNGLVVSLFEQWRLFLSEAIDYSEAFGGRKLEPLKKWVRRAGLTIADAAEGGRFFFALHTYFALLVKLLAWLALSRHMEMEVKLGAPSFAGLATADGETLRQRLREMESGGIFRTYGIANLLEGDFFAWYLHAWNDDLEEAIREILKRLDEYDPTTLRLIPKETRDLFKKLYHYLLPREMRHNLGEYYTPDWLARRLLVQVDHEFFSGDPRHERLLGIRFLDPACGSGTFLLLIIARMRELAQALSVQEGAILEAILTNVVGFDLNPLAVLTARVNYLLAIADLLKHWRGEITVPIYLADSVRTPAAGEDIFSHDAYEFPTAVGKFLVPAQVAKPGLFDRFCDLLEDSLRADLLPEAFLSRIGRELAPPEWNEPAEARTRALYGQLQDLHRRGLNGIWARLLKNNFAPLTVGQFDAIVGNPPWVNWENLPDGYRQSIATLWQRYGIFSHKGFDAILGKSKDDISILMTYVVMDKLLKENGRLGFVITQSVFKTVGGGKGFRRFQISKPNGAPLPLRVVHVDDMVDLNPFEGASNRTAVMVLEKGQPTKYPVPYTLWRKVKGVPFTYESTLEEVTEATRRMNFRAEPVDPSDPTSPWLTARPKALRAIRKVLGSSDYVAHAGAYTGGANGVYWVEVVYRRHGLVVVHNLTEGAKVKVDEVTEPIEPDLLYPLLRGRDVRRWRAEPSALILLTHEPDMRLNAIPEKDLQTRYPYTYGYLKRFEPVLRKRASRGISDMLQKGAPFYTMFAVGDYTFAPWKVVWREQASEMTASVVGSQNAKPVVPDHKLMLVGCGSKEEAHYVCALLNSALGRFVAHSYAVVIQMDPHILEHIRIPRFDPKNLLHQRLAELSEKAHQAATVADEAGLREIEAEIDVWAAKLWGLSDEELREIQESLREVAGGAQEEGKENES